MKIAVIDGQGGGIGRLITEQLRKHLPQSIQILALGTNAMATALMLKAGANEGASGENAIVHGVEEADFILGPLGLVLANSMRGELTPRMAEAIATCRATKILLPLNLSRTEIVGVKEEPLPHLVEEMIVKLKKMMGGNSELCVKPMPIFTRMEKTS